VKVGSRVEALYKGKWYKATILKLPAHDPDNRMRWTVECDIDKKRLLFYASQIRVFKTGRNSPSSEARQFDVGSRVEANYQGKWYRGNVVKVPADDKNGKDRWTVQCDVHKAGMLTYTKRIRSPGVEIPSDVNPMAQIRIPAYWTRITTSSLARGDADHVTAEAAYEATSERSQVPERLIEDIQELMDETWKDLTTRDRASTKVSKLKVVHVLRNENAALWA